MPIKLYRNKAWMYKRYVVDRKSAAEIAEEANTTEMTITRWLNEFGLIRNPRSWSSRNRR